MSGAKLELIKISKIAAVMPTTSMQKLHDDHYDDLVDFITFEESMGLCTPSLTLSYVPRIRQSTPLQICILHQIAPVRLPLHQPLIFQSNLKLCPEVS